MKLSVTIGIAAKWSLWSNSHGHRHFVGLITNISVESTQRPITISTLIILIKDIIVEYTVPTEVYRMTTDEEAPIVDLTIGAMCLVDSVHFS